MNRACLFLFMAFLVAFCGCQKLQRHLVITGDWEVQEGFLNGSSINAIPFFLQHYNTSEDCCHYYICFDGDGTVEGLYFTFDTLNYKVNGTWDLLDKDLVYVDLDFYVEGVFKLEKIKAKEFRLTTDSNLISYGTNNYYALDLRIKRL